MLNPNDEEMLVTRSRVESWEAEDLITLVVKNEETDQDVSQLSP